MNFRNIGTKIIGLMIVGLCLVVKCYGLEAQQRADVEPYVILEKKLKDGEIIIFRVNKDTGDTFVDEEEDWKRYANAISFESGDKELLKGPFEFDIRTNSDGNQVLVAFDKASKKKLKLAKEIKLPKDIELIPKLAWVLRRLNTEDKAEPEQLDHQVIEYTYWTDCGEDVCRGFADDLHSEGWYIITILTGLLVFISPFLAW